MKKNKIILIVLTVFMVFFIMHEFVFYKYREIYLELEVTLPLFCKIDYKDIHGGFLGDGETFAKVNLSESQTDRFVKRIKNNQHWKEEPVNENLIHRIQSSDEFGYKIPNIKNGYWIFKDRHSKATDIYDENGMFEEERGSVNYSVGILNLDTNILYFYQDDT